MSDRASGVISSVSYATSGGTFMFGALTVNEFAAIVGVILATVTAIINWVYKHKMYKLQLEKAKQERQIKK